MAQPLRILPLPLGWREPRFTVKELAMKKHYDTGLDWIPILGAIVGALIYLASEVLS